MLTDVFGHFRDNNVFLACPMPPIVITAISLFSVHMSFSWLKTANCQHETHTDLTVMENISIQTDHPVPT